jgi:hypothetical protein
MGEIHWDSCIRNDREACDIRQTSVYRQNITAVHLHLHLSGCHNSLRHPLYHGVLKRRLHVREAGRTETCLSLSHPRRADPYVGYAGRCLERRCATRHRSLRNLRRKWSLTRAKLLLEKTGVIEALW